MPLNAEQIAQALETELPVSSSTPFDAGWIPDVIAYPPLEYTLANGSILHSAYRGYKESRANGSGVFGSLDNFVLGGISGATRTYLGYLLAGAAGLGSGGALAVGAGVNEVFNGLSKSREANMRLDKMHTVVRLPGISHVRNATRNGLKSMLGENLGEKIFPREHFGDGQIWDPSRRSLVHLQRRSKEQYMKSEGVKKFIKAIKITQSQPQIPLSEGTTGEGTLPFQALRDSLSAYIPGYDQDDIHETQSEKIIENILRKAVNTEGGLLAGKSKKEVLESIENFGDHIHVYENVNNLLSESRNGRPTADLFYKVFNDGDNAPLINGALSSPEGEDIRKQLAFIIKGYSPTMLIEGASKVPSKKEIKEGLNSNLYSFLEKIPNTPPDNTRKAIIDDFFHQQKGGPLQNLLEKELKKQNFVNISRVPPEHGSFRAFNEKHDTILGGKKQGVAGVIQSTRNALASFSQKKYTDSNGNEKEMEASDKILNILGSVGTLFTTALAGKEVYDMAQKYKPAKNS